MATRGTAILVSEDKIFISEEFNGSMYPDGYGDEMIGILINEVSDKATFKNALDEFNRQYFEYDDPMVSKSYKDTPKKRKDVFDFSNPEGWYNKLCFSDYVFIKNESETPLEIIPRKYEGNYDTENVSKLVLKKGNVVRLKFGWVMPEDVNDGFYEEQGVILK